MTAVFAWHRQVLPVPPKAIRELKGVGVIWITKPQDCVSCQAITGQLRHLQAQSRVPVVVVQIGAKDRTLVEKALRYERLDASIMPLSYLEYRVRFGRTPLPSVQIVADGIVRFQMALDRPGKMFPDSAVAILRQTAISAKGGEGNDKEAQ